MSLTKEGKVDIIHQHRRHEKDSGSTEVQIALLTSRISGLTDHFKFHKKDQHSRRGLLQMVSRRRRLLHYLQRVDPARYQAAITSLGLRK